MKTETFESDIKTFNGEALKTPVPFKGSAELFTEVAEVKEAGEWPSNDEIVEFVNRNRLNNARQKAMKAALDEAGYKKPTLEQPSERFKQMVKILMAAGEDEATARTIANTTLKTEF